MKRTPAEMAEHIRAAIENANGVLKEATAEGYKVELTVVNGYDPRISVDSIEIKLVL